MGERIKWRLKTIKEQSMVRAEWKHLASNRMLIASLVVLVFIPIMYGGFFLGGVWDPYGNTKNLPVAIVNEDKGAVIASVDKNIGKETVQNLKDNHDLGWRELSAQQATECLDTNECYMTITIPKDFSKNAATISSDSPTKSTVRYTITPARNYVGALITEQAAKKIKQTVATSLSKAYVAAILSSLNNLGDGLTQASDGTMQLATGATALQSGIGEYAAGVTRVATGQAALNQGLVGLQTGAQQLQQGLNRMNGSLPSQAQIAQLTSSLQQLQTGLTTLQQATSQPSPELTKAQADLTAKVTALAAKLQQLQHSAQGANAELLRVGSAIQAGLAAGNPTIEINTADAAKLLEVISQAKGIMQDARGLREDIEQVKTTVITQLGAVRSGIDRLAAGAQQLTPPTIQALNGYNAVRTGSGQLAGGTGQLVAGVTTAVQASSQLMNGIQQLTHTSPRLVQGAAQLANGTNALQQKLADAAGQIALTPTGETTAEHIAAPVTAEKHERGSIPNYGYALAPYVLSLGLFVGTLVFNVIYPVRRRFGQQKSHLAWWIAKISVGLTVATAQALMLDAIMMWGLGLHPDNLDLFIVTSVLTSVSYMSLTMLLTIALDNVGRFLAMILLVMQLGGAGGTFPIQTSPEFFQAIHPFLPMTYSVNAFREAISSGIGSTLYAHSMSVLVVLAIVCQVSLVLFLWRHGNRAFRHESVDA